MLNKSLKSPTLSISKPWFTKKKILTPLRTQLWSDWHHHWQAFGCLLLLPFRPCPILDMPDITRGGPGGWTCNNGLHCFMAFGNRKQQWCLKHAMRNWRLQKSWPGLDVLFYVCHFQRKRKNIYNKEKKQISHKYIYIYLEPKWPLFLKGNPPKQGLFQSKQWSLGSRCIYIYTYVCVLIYIYKYSIHLYMLLVLHLFSQQFLFNNIWWVQIFLFGSYRT